MDASAYEALANAVLIILTGLLGFFGIKKGIDRKTAEPEEEQKTFEVAGALVDSTSVRALAGSIEGHSLALAETRAAGRELKASIDKLAEALSEHCEMVDRHLNEVRELRHEMSRRR